MHTKPLKPRCQTCKLGLIICVDHQIQCRNSAFSACNFCRRYRCETGACKTKICCEGAAARVSEVESQLRAVKARSGSSASVSRPSLKVGVDDVRRMLYAVCSMLDAATTPGPLSRLPLTAHPGQEFSLRDDVAAVPVKMPSTAADAPVKMLSSPADVPAADAPVKLLNPAADAPVLPMPVKMLSTAADAPVKLSPAADAPMMMLSPAADAPVMMLNPAADAPVMPSPAADAPVMMPCPAAVAVPVLPFDAPAVLHLWRVVPAATCPVPNLRDPAADMMTMRARPVSRSPHPNCQSPLTDRRHSCANCASLGQWCTCSKGNHMTKRTQSLRSASTPLLGSTIHLKSSGGSREPTEAQKITPVPFSPSDR